MIQKIEIGEHCYGQFVTVDDSSIIKEECDDRSEEEIKNTKLDILSELVNSIDTMDYSDWITICEIICRGNNFKLSEEGGSEGDSCEQCGNWNYRDVYARDVK